MRFLILCLSLWASNALAQTLPLPEPWRWLAVTDRYERSITAMLADAGPTAPLVVILPGSGCAPIARPRGGGTALGLQALARQAMPGVSILTVEKPGTDLAHAPQGGAAEGCSPRFHQEHTLERWVAAVAAALDAARAGRTPPAIIAIGHSEGAATVARLARDYPAITHVVHLAGSGTGQAYDLLRARAGDPAAVERVLATLAEIARAPDSDTRFAWGHPHRRWPGFLAQDPTADLLASRAQVLVGYASADRTVPPESSEILIARLATAGRPPRIWRVEGGDHGLNAPGEASPAGLLRVLQAVPSWVAGTPAVR
jgi:pimeloyl-ACP methyl ester carboxylesterase